jgi:phosphoglycerate kinase
MLNKALKDPKRPLCVITSGAKISTKIGVLENLCTKADIMVIGGAIANTLLQEKGIDIGASLSESNHAATIGRFLQKAKENHCRIILPEDAVTAPAPDAPAGEICPIEDIGKGQMILDIGPKTITALTTMLDECRAVLVNGPLGVFENPAFSEGSKKIFTKIAHNTKNGTLFSIAGGGDTLAALSNAGVKNHFSYVSTAGGAFLEFLEGRPLPGLVALSEARNG